MEEYYQQNSEPSDLDILSQLSIYVDSSTRQLMYACDWQDSQLGMSCISEIIAQLKGSAIFDKILESILQQCVIQNRMDDFNKIKNDIDNHTLNTRKNKELVVRPRDAR